MNDLAIRIEHLGKRYKLAKTSSDADHRASLYQRLTGPFQNIAARLGKQAATQPFWALKDVTCDIKQGDVVGIVGRNGAGKSTLLKILSRITEPTTGQVLINGRIRSLLEVGTGFHPELTGRENIYLNGAIQGLKKSEIDNKFDEIVAFAEVDQFLDTPVKRYSSGMYVRLAFAVAAHLEPEILLVDEVLAVGDAGFQKKSLGKMNEAAKQGRTVLFVSHSMPAITQLCSHVIWLDRGEIVQMGRASDVIKSYLAEGNPQRAERYWDVSTEAPGDDRVRLRSCRILQNMTIASVIDINEPFQIELEFEVLKQAKNLITGISFYNEQGICLSASCDWRPNNLGPALYRKRMDIHPHLLAEGMISVLAQLVFYDPVIPSIVLPDALIFEAVDSAHPLSVRGHYKGNWPGLMRVHLPWTEAEILQ